MKLIIDIPDKQYELIKKSDYNAFSVMVSKECMMYAIKTGTPLSVVLEGIKEEVREWYWLPDKQEMAEDPCVVDAMIDLFIRTIDEHISGESQESEE